MALDSGGAKAIAFWLAFYNQTRPHSIRAGTTPERCYHEGLLKAA